MFQWDGGPAADSEDEVSWGEEGATSGPAAAAQSDYCPHCPHCAFADRAGAAVVKIISLHSGWSYGKKSLN